MPLITGDVDDILPTYVMETLPMSMLLETPLFDIYMDDVSPQTSSIRFITGHSIALVDHGGKAACVGVARHDFLMPHSETVMRWRTDRTGLSQQNTASRRKSVGIVP